MISYSWSDLPQLKWFPTIEVIYNWSNLQLKWSTIEVIYNWSDLQLKWSTIEVISYNWSDLQQLKWSPTTEVISYNWSDLLQLLNDFYRMNCMRVKYKQLTLKSSSKQGQWCQIFVLLAPSFTWNTILFSL